MSAPLGILPSRLGLAATVLAIGVSLPWRATGQVPLGSVTGVVGDPGDRPVPFALVRLPGGRQVFADNQGGFELNSVAAGHTWVAAIGPGCAVGMDSVRVSEGQASVVRLVVPTTAQEGAGQPEGVAAMSRAELSRRNFRTVYEALRAIAPYMIGHITGEVGGDRSVSNRAARTFERNEPLVLLDGIRLTNVSVAALEDIPIEDLERIEVARSAAAAWRYGMGSAGGAIVLTTTRAGVFDLAACEVSFPAPR